jgi:hypothetical protein
MKMNESVGLVPGVDNKLVIHDSVVDGMCCGYGDGSIALYATVHTSDVLIISSNGAFGTSQTNVFTVSDLALAFRRSSRSSRIKRRRKRR